MKRFSQKNAQSSLAELNITPLLDLAFVLLVIFMITTPLLEQGINLSTPSSTPNQMALDPASVKTISIDKSGNIYIEEKQVDLKTLEARLIKLKNADPKLAIGIRADKNLPYEKVVAVIDALQRTGITKFGLITKVDETRK